MASKSRKIAPVLVDPSQGTGDSDRDSHGERVSLGGGSGDPTAVTAKFSVTG